MLTGAYEFFLRVLVIHLALAVIDSCLKYCLHSHYTSLKLRTGISIGLFYVEWSTKLFNRYILKFSSRRSKFQKKWFMLGTWISLAILPLAVYLILQSTFALGVNLVFKKIINYGTGNSANHLTPYLNATIVGINLPISDIFYYVISLFICIVIHEFGHALAAVREGLTIAEFGVDIVFIFPIAFVRIEGLEKLTPARRLRVVCAGVWHNIILTLFAGGVVFMLPFVFSPFYDYGAGVQIVSINEKSPMQGTGGLQLGDVITNINNCPVVDQNTWVRCIQNVAKLPTFGYCLTPEFIHENDETVQIRQQSSVIECCRNDTLSGLCFEYLERTDNPLELPQYSCLRVRSVIDQYQNLCQSPNDCDGLHCFRPLMAENMKLFVFIRKNKNEALFLGQPTEVHNHLFLSEFIPKTYFSAALPNCIYKFSNFMIMFSGALAAVNLIPCFHFDGQRITEDLVFLYIWKKLDLNKASPCFIMMSLFPHYFISKAITSLGTFILVVYTILAFVMAFTN